MNIATVKRFAKFSIVGGIGVLVNLSYLWFFTERYSIFYLVADLPAIELAILNNFIWNQVWTWKGKGKAGWKALLKRVAQYHLSASLAMFVTLVCLWLLTEYLHLHYLLSKLIGIVAGTMINFLMSDRWIFVGGMARVKDKEGS